MSGFRTDEPGFGEPSSRGAIVWRWRFLPPCPDRAADPLKRVNPQGPDLLPHAKGDVRVTADIRPVHRVGSRLPALRPTDSAIDALPPIDLMSRRHQLKRFTCSLSGESMGEPPANVSTASGGIRNGFTRRSASGRRLLSPPRCHVRHRTSAHPTSTHPLPLRHPAHHPTPQIISITGCSKAQSGLHGCTLGGVGATG
jgi:hypothetical protein